MRQKSVLVIVVASAALVTALILLPKRPPDKPAPARKTRDRNAQAEIPTSPQRAIEKDPTAEPRPTVAESSLDAEPIVEVSQVALEFLPAELQVRRDYDQRGQVSLRNNGESTVRVRVRRQPTEEDQELLAGFVGRGSEDWNEVTWIEMQPGETWPFPFIVHANRATRDEYDVSLEALVPGANGTSIRAATGSVKVRIQQARLVVAIEWVESRLAQDRARLIKVLRIVNRGDPVPEFTVSTRSDLTRASGELGDKVRMSPTIEKVMFKADAVLEVRVWPLLYSGFDELRGSLFLHGLGQRQEVPYDVKMPAGKRVFLALSRSTGTMTNSGQRCTNQSSATYAHDAVAGDPDGDTDDEDTVKEEEEEDEEPRRVPGTLFRRSPRRANSAEPRPVAPPTGTFNGGLVDATDLGTRDVEGAVPSAANGSDDRRSLTELLSAGERDTNDCGPRSPTAPDRSPPSALRDPVFNSRETTSFRDRDGLGILVARHGRDASRLDYYQVSPSGARSRQTISRGAHRIFHPALGRGPNGQMLATYARPSSEGGTIIEVHDTSSPRGSTLGDPKSRSFQPQVVTDENAADIVFYDDGVVRGARLDRAWTTGESRVLFRNADGTAIRSLLRARRSPDGRITVLVQNAEGQVTVGARRFQGDAADFAYAADGTEVIVIRRGGNVFWTRGAEEPERLLVRGGPDTGLPTLVRKRDGGLRLYYHEAGDPAGRKLREGTFWRDYKDGVWSREERVPQPEALVTRAAVAMQFSLPWQRANYKLMNTTVFLNDTEIGRLTRHVPSGRYVFFVPVAWLHYRGLGLSPGKRNVVSMRIQGIGRGSFHISDRCEVYTLHRLVQEFLVAESEEEAQRLGRLSRPEIRHGVPDLLVASNDWQLPPDVQPGDVVPVRLLLANVGDAPVPPGVLVATGRGLELGRVSYPEVTAFESVSVAFDMTFPNDWNGKDPLELVVKTVVPGDPRPDNHEIRLYALRQWQANVAGPTNPSRVDFSRLVGVVTVDEVVDAGQPFVVELQKRAAWYKLRAPDKGQLQVELVEVPEGVVLGLDLFSGEGLPLRPDDGVLGFSGEYVFLRVGLRPGVVFPQDSRLKLWWE